MIRTLALGFFALAMVSGPAGAAAPGAARTAAPTLVRVCYNDQLGARDEGHFSLLLMRGVQRAVPEVELRFEPVPWLRCLLRASRGEFDGILGASFTAERAADLAYPRTADGAVDESKRMFSQGYRLLRRRGGSLGWNGREFTGIDGLIGVERAHSAASFAMERGVAVDDNHPDVRAMLAKLRAGRLAGAMVSEPLLASLAAEPGVFDGLEQVHPPLARKAYFLVFSRAFAARHPELTARLWEAVARERETPAVRKATGEQQGEWSISR